METSELYKELLAGDHAVEHRLTIGETGVLVTRQGEGITFGGHRILVASSGADGGYDESMLMTVETSGDVFSGNTPSVGGAVAGEIDVVMLRPFGSIPRQARLAPYSRLTDGARHSEWVPGGVYYVDTRKEVPGDVEKIRFHGYDAMLKAEQDYPESHMDWPARDIDVVREIAAFMDVPIHPDTVAIMTTPRNVQRPPGYPIQYPGEYSCREVLEYIAGLYAGNFVMSNDGSLRLITLWGLPKETRLLVTETRQYLTFGGVRIRV